MSNDIRIRTSQWTIRPDADTAEVEAAILGLEDSVTLSLDLDETDGELVSLLEKAGFDLDTGNRTIVGSAGTSEWVNGYNACEVLSALAPFSEAGSYVEFESEYNSDPARWVLNEGRVREIAPEYVWKVPGDLGPWALGAEAVREEVREAPELHDLTPEQAAAVIALDDTTINNAVQQSVDDSAWETFDRLRREVIGRLAQGAGSEDVGR